MEKQFTEVQFGDQKIQVPKGGYYDRFHLNPNLDEVARDPAAGNVDFFRRIPKSKVASRVGPTWAPKFYYRARQVQLLFLAPTERLRANLPVPLQPLEPIPGRGLVALTLFSYLVCDNDPYNEASIAVVIRRPGAHGPHAIELLDSLRRRSFFAHVLALPVTTEVARVRGVYGYQLPKWLTPIDLSIGDSINGRIGGPNGRDDLFLKMDKPDLRTAVPQSRMSTTNMIHLVDGKWNKTTVLNNILSYASSTLPKGVDLKRNGGPMTQLLDGLGASKIIRADVIKDSQMVLNLPQPLEESIL